MSTIRWTSAVLIFICLYAAYLGARGWGFAALLVVLFLIHFSTYRGPRVKRPVSNHYSKDQS